MHTPVATKERRNQRLVARVSGADKQLFKRAAAMEGRSVATFVVIHAREVAKRIVSENEAIQLNASESRRFVEALLRPTRAVPAHLKKAVAAHRRQIVG